MLIPCPHCGIRPVEEFTFLGDAMPERPESNDPSSMEHWFEYVYLRENPRGVMQEFVHHSGGCRSWLVVTRDTQSHDVSNAVMAKDYVIQRAKGKR